MEKGKEQNWEDRGHRTDMQAKRSEPPARKVTLIEVRENLAESGVREDQEEAILLPGKEQVSW